MSEHVQIRELADHVGDEVSVLGWVHNLRSSGKIAFLIVRDGTGLVQGVLSAGDVSPEVWSRLEGLDYEASVKLRGSVREDKRAPGGYELSLTELEVVGPSAE
ncbi:MAG: OB-fold nucleic acid binding domain-containing protein, partial [Gemmatimonadales bacterium]